MSYFRRFCKSANFLRFKVSYVRRLCKPVNFLRFKVSYLDICASLLPFYFDKYDFKLCNIYWDVCVRLMEW
jgi:hypothetical protein